MEKSAVQADLMVQIAIALVNREGRRHVIRTRIDSRSTDTNKVMIHGHTSSRSAEFGGHFVDLVAASRSLGASMIPPPSVRWRW
jgi:hypothetical protein